MPAPSIFVRSLDPEGEADIVAEGARNTLQYHHATPSNPFANAQVAGPALPIPADYCQGGG